MFYSYPLGETKRLAFQQSLTPSASYFIHFIKVFFEPTIYFNCTCTLWSDIIITGIGPEGAKIR